MQTAEKTKCQELFEWCKEKKIFNYVDVQNWNKQPNYYLRAERTIRDFVSTGLLRRIPLAECLDRGLVLKGRAPLAWFETI